VGPTPLEREREALVMQNHQNDFEITQLRGQLDRQHRVQTELAELESAMEQLSRPDGRLGTLLTEFDHLSQRVNEGCNSLSIRVSQIKGHIEDLIITATESDGGGMIIVKAVEDLLRNIQRKDNRFYTMLDGVEDMIKRIRENQLDEERRRIEDDAEYYSYPSHVLSPGNSFATLAVFRRVETDVFLFFFIVLPPPSTTSSYSGPVWPDHGCSASDSDSARSVDTTEDLLDLEESPEVTIPEAPLITLEEESSLRNSSAMELLNGLEISPGLSASSSS